MGIIPHLADRANTIETRAEQQAAELLKKGEPREKVVDALEQLGLENRAALRITSEVSVMVVKLDQRRALIGVILGVALLLAGALVAFFIRHDGPSGIMDYVCLAAMALGAFKLMISAYAYFNVSERT